MTELDIKDIVNDDLNANKGTEFGMKMLDQSIDRLGFGRSILLDKDNRIVAGNKTFEKALEKGITKVIVVETTGDQLVAVKRVDTDLDSKDGRELALADNAVAKENLAWDKEVLERLSTDFGVDRGEWGFEREQARQATESERSRFEKAKRPSLVCPYCFSEFDLEEEEDEQ